MIRFTLRLTEKEHESMTNISKELGISNNRYIRILVKDKLGKDFTDKVVLNNATVASLNEINSNITRLTEHLRRINRNFYKDKSGDINEIIDAVESLKEYANKIKTEMIV